MMTFTEDAAADPFMVAKRNALCSTNSARSQEAQSQSYCVSISVVLARLLLC